MSKGGPSRVLRKTGRYGRTSLLEELLIRGRARVKALRKKGGRKRRRGGNGAASRVRARNQEEKGIMRGTREKVMQFLGWILLIHCHFTPPCPYRLRSDWAGGPRCVPRGPAPGDDSLRNVQKETVKNSAACDDDDDVTDGTCQLYRPVTTSRSSLIANCTVKATTRTLFIWFAWGVDLWSLQVRTNAFPVQLWIEIFLHFKKCSNQSHFKASN